jgi:hypothetical protein
MEKYYNISKFESGEWLDKWRGIESIWVDMSWFNRPELTLKKYIKCVGTYCGIGQVDWWYASELERLTDEEKDELETLCKKNRDIIRESWNENETLKKKKFKVITLCGSTKFKSEYLDVTKWLTMQGNIVISVGLFGQADGEKLTVDEKVMLDEVHKAKIDLCEEIFVINPNNYIGSSTKSEIEYAHLNGKGVRYFNDELKQYYDWKAEFENRTKIENWNLGVLVNL